MQFSGSTLPFSFPDLVLWLDASIAAPLQGTFLTVPDRSTQHNDMVLTSVTYINRGTVGSFKNGTQPGFSLTTSSLFTFTNTITFPSAPLLQTIFAVVNPTASGTLYGSGNFGIVAGKIQILDTGGSHTLNSLTSVPGSVFSTIAGTISSPNAAVYLNGVLDNTAANFTTVTNAMTAIGQNTATMAGGLAEVLVFKQSLSAADIAALHRYAVDKWT